MVKRYEVPLVAVAMAIALTAMACRGEAPPRDGQTAPGADLIQEKAPVELVHEAGVK